MLVAAVRIVRHCPEAIWAPSFWILMNSAVFYGIGPLVEVYGNPSTRAALLYSELAVSPSELTRSNLLSASGITCLISGFWLHVCANPGKWKAVASSQPLARSYISPIHVAIAFVVGGAILRYLFIKPAQWGMIDMVIPGVLTSVAPILDVGFGIMTYLAVRGSPRLRCAIAICLPIHLLLTLLAMSKMELVIALMFPALGAYLGNRSLSRLAIMLAVIAYVFVPAQNLVHIGRAAILEKSGTINDAGYLERIDIVIDYISRQPDPVPLSYGDEQRQGWWTRLNFSGEQALAMALYDAGAAGSTLSNAWIRFIPRVLWPDKPIIRPLGAEFYNISVNRQGTSNLGLPIYGDLYWNYGWAGVIVGCLLIGWLFAAMSWRSIEALKKMEFIVLPAVLIAMLSAAQGLNNFVLDSIISRLPIYFAYLFSAGLLVKYLKSKRYTLDGPKT